MNESNCCIAALWLYSKDYQTFTETIPCHKIYCPSGRPRVTTAADDHYIVLQHLLNRRLTAAATGRQYGIHPQTVRNWLRQNVQPICAYRRTSVEFSLDVIEGQGGIGAAVTCTWDMLIGI